MVAMMTDPIADMLTRIRNSIAVGHEQVEMPLSKLREGIAKILVVEGYIDR
ncbi:MAG TPA: 30S ribosomal protein S8, partial [Acidimicrobiia bacterium]|nr:30S ribosomal protein S8 [Acidimicrobiia bacterium]